MVDSIWFHNRLPNYFVARTHAWMSGLKVKSSIFEKKGSREKSVGIKNIHEIEHNIFLMMERSEKF